MMVRSHRGLAVLAGSPIDQLALARPIGTIESIDFSPVCIGWLTLCPSAGA